MASSRLRRQLRKNLRHADQRIAGEDEAVKPRVLGFELIIELLAQPCRDLLLISEVSIAGRMRRWIENSMPSCAGRPPPPTACPDIAVCTQAATVMATGAMDLTERGRRRGFVLEAGEALSQSGPSSAAMRRRTKAQPIGGAWLCSWPSSAAYSAGRASGMVASSCATFMIGPFSPPSAAARLAASRSRSGSRPSRRLAAMRAATPPTLAPTRP